MKRLDGPVRKQMQGTIDKIISGDPTVWAQTHPLGMALKGWNATKGSRGHRVVHQPNDQGGIHIGYVGLHEYDKAIQRLTSRTAGANGSLPEGLTYHRIEGPEEHGLVAEHPEHGPVGVIKWGRPGHFLEDEVTHIGVHPDYRRRGLATDLWLRASEMRPNLIHSESRTDAGDAWARSMHPDLEERMHFPEGVGSGFGPEEFKGMQRVEAGANGDLPDLTFKHYAPGERPVGYSTKLRKMLYSRDHHVEAYAEHPETGQPVMVGHAQYSLWDSARRGPRASVGMMTTNPAWRRRGINSAVIDEIRRTHPDHRVGYDFLSPDGAAFVKSQTGRDVTPAVGPLESQAAVRNVSDTASDGDGITDGMMVAIVPPASLVEDLAIDEGESPEQLHITLAYLGQTSEYSEAQLEALHEVVESWADGQAKFTATVQGVGTFLPADEDGQHVLWASVDAPGLHRLHTSLVDYLKGHGYDPREDHSFTPHVTLAYGKHHFRFVPKVQRVDFKVAEIWVCVGGRWESVPLLG